MMRPSIVYGSQATYSLLMRALYGRHYASRHQAIAALIPVGASVVDVCCGPAGLYRDHLRMRQVRYTGLDINERFAERVTEAGGRGVVWDVHSDKPLPSAEYVMMQASLYHFLPDAARVIDRMLAAATTQVIVAEPIRNLASSENRLVASLARRLTNAGRGHEAHRFTEDSLDTLMRRYQDRVVGSSLIAGGREKLYVLSARPAPDAPGTQP